MALLLAPWWFVASCSRPEIIPDEWAQASEDTSPTEHDPEPPKNAVSPTAAVSAVAVSPAAAVSAVATEEPESAPAWRPYGVGLDLSGFVPVKTAVTHDGAREWLEIEGAHERIRLMPVPPPSPRALCVNTSPPVYLGFSTTPRMRLALRAERISLEREIGDCWVDVSLAPKTLNRGKPLRRIAPAATPLAMALDPVDRALKGVTLVLAGDVIELTRGDEAIASEALTAAIVDEDFDEDGGGTNRREVHVTPLRDQTKRLVALEIVTDEGLTGGGGPIGGSREYARKVRWNVALKGETATTTLLVADVEAPFSGDGYTGSDDGHQRVWRHTFDGGAVIGRWSSRSPPYNALAAHLPVWSIVSSDEDAHIELTLPTLDRDIGRGKTLVAAPSITEVVSSDLSFSVEPKGLTITARGEQTMIPLFTSTADDALVTATYACTALVCRIAARATLPAPDGEDEYGHPLMGDSRSASVFVSRSTLQVLRP